VRHPGRGDVAGVGGHVIWLKNLLAPSVAPPPYFIERTYETSKDVLTGLFAAANESELRTLIPPSADPAALIPSHLRTDIRFEAATIVEMRWTRTRHGHYERFAALAYRVDCRITLKDAASGKVYARAQFRGDPPPAKIVVSSGPSRARADGHGPPPNRERLERFLARHLASAPAGKKKDKSRPPP
jgi:hypothetical protein